MALPGALGRGGIIAAVADIVDAERGSHVDRLTVVYQSVADADSEPRSTVVMVVDAGVCLDRDELLRQLERLHFTRDAQGRPQHVPCFSREEYGHHSWGGAGAALEILVGVAAYGSAGIVGGAAWDGLKAIGKRIGAAARPPEAEGYTAALDDQMAIERPPPRCQ